MAALFPLRLPIFVVKTPYLQSNLFILPMTLKSLLTLRSFIVICSVNGYETKPWQKFI
jgi:hypothetical protein